MDGGLQERREEDKEKKIYEQEYRSPKPNARVRVKEEEEKEMDMMKAPSRDKARSELINGYTSISTSSSFTSCPFLSSLHQGRGEDGEEEEVRVTIITVEDESCPSEPFGTIRLEPTKQAITRTENRQENGKEEGEMQVVEEAKEEDEEEAELMSPSVHPQHQSHSSAGQHSR